MYVRPIIAAPPTVKREEPHPRSSADCKNRSSPFCSKTYDLGRGPKPQRGDLVNRMELVPRMLFFCVVHGEEKRKGRERGNFFGGFVVAENGSGAVGRCVWLRGLDEMRRYVAGANWFWLGISAACGLVSTWQPRSWDPTSIGRDNYGNWMLSDASPWTSTSELLFWSLFPRNNNSEIIYTKTTEP